MPKNYFFCRVPGLSFGYEETGEGDDLLPQGGEEGDPLGNSEGKTPDVEIVVPGWVGSAD